MRRITIIGISLTLFLYASLFAVFSCSDNPVVSEVGLPGDSWREVFPSQDPEGIQHIVATGTSFVGVGSDNRVYSSDDGGNWRRIGLVSSDDVFISDLAWTGEMLIAVGIEDTLGRVYVSETGKSWEQNETPNAGRLRAVASNGEIIVAAGSERRVLRKESDADWELVDISAIGNMRDVTWAGNRFVATASEGILSSDDGKEWTLKTLTISPGPTPTIASSGQSVVAIGKAGGVVTVDGIVWQPIPFFSGFSRSRRVFWEGGRYVALTNGGIIAFSTDGITWAGQRIRFLSSGIDIAWNGSVYSLTGSPGVKMTAPDTVSWIVHSFSGALRAGFSDIESGDDEIIAMGGSAPIMISPNGKLWIGSIPPTLYAMNSVTWSSERYILVGARDSIYSSIDRISWQASPLSSNLILNAVHGNGGRYVAAGFRVIVFSEDGVNWETVYTDSSVTWLQAITKSGSLWLAVGLSGGILSSPDGRNWTKQKSGTTQKLIAVDWTGKEFLVAGSDGAILRSTDGESWELLNQFNGFGFQVYDAVWANGRYVVVGSNGLVITSDDLVNWINRDLDPRTTITSITWDGRRLFAIHDFDRIIVSP